MEEIRKKPRILCRHGFRQSAAIPKKMVMSRWPESILEKLDLVFLDGPYPSQGKSSAEDIFEPPYYEWFQFQADKDFQEFYNFEECLDYLEGYMIENGPFDGILGFSRYDFGCIFARNAKRRICSYKSSKVKVPNTNSRSKIWRPQILAANAFSSPLQCPSLHLIGEMDFRKEEIEALVQCFIDPIVIYHSQGHTIPTLDEDGEKKMLQFLEKIEELN